MLNGIRLALFDWNGTLLNDTRLNYACVCHLFEKYGATVTPPSLEEYRSKICNSAWSDFFHDLGVPRSIPGKEMLTEWFAHYRKLTKSEEFKLHLGTVALLDFFAAQRVPCIIVTNCIESIEDYLRELEIHHCFARIIQNPGRHGWSKAVAIRGLLEEYGLNPHEAFYLDDTRDGIMHAKEAGVHTIGFLNGLHAENLVREAEPTHIVHALSEVIDLIPLLNQTRAL